MFLLCLSIYHTCGVLLYMQTPFIISSSVLSFVSNFQFISSFSQSFFSSIPEDFTMANVHDEHGNPVQLTDERANPVQLTDEFGNPVHLTGVATTGSKLESTMHPTGVSTAGSESIMHPTGVSTTGSKLEPSGRDVGQMQFPREHEGSPRRSSSSSSSSSEEEERDAGQGGRRRKKKGLTQKIKEKLTGSGKHKEEARVAEHHQSSSTVTLTLDDVEHQEHGKKGVMEKIREKLPGHH